MKTKSKYANARFAKVIKLRDVKNRRLLIEALRRGFWMCEKHGMVVSHCSFTVRIEQGDRIGKFHAAVHVRYGLESRVE